MLNPHIFLNILIWLFTSFLLSVFSTQAQEIVDITNLETKDGLKERQVNHVVRDAQGYFYLVTDNYIQRYDGKTFTNVNTSALSDYKLRLQDIESTELQGDYVILNQTRSQETLAIKSSELSTRNIDPNLLPKPNYKLHFNSEGFSIIIGNNKYLWTSEFIYKKVDNHYKVLHVLPHIKSAPFKLKVDKEGNIIVYYSARKLFVDQLYVLDANEQLHDFSLLAKEYDTAIDLHTDKAFHKWMIVGHNAIKIISLKREGIERAGMIPNIPKDQFGKLIRGIAPTGDAIYYCTENPAIYKHDTKTNQSERVFSNTAFNADGFRIMKYDSLSEQLYQIGFDENNPELLKLDLNNEALKAFPVKHRIIDFIFLNATDILIIGQEKSSLKGILFKLNTTNGAITTLMANLPNVTTILHDQKKKEYWLGSSEGLIVLNENFEIKIKRIQLNKNLQNLRNDEISMFVPFSEKLMVCTKGSGLLVLDRATNKITKRLTQESGLSNNVITAGVEDLNGKFWVSTYNGLNVIDTNFQVLKNLYQLDGLSHPEFNTKAVAIDRDGLLHFGSINGLTIIDPIKVMQWKDSHQIAINKIVSSTDSRLSALKNGDNILSSVDSIIIDYKVTDYYRYVNTTPLINFSSPNAKLHKEGGKIILTDITSPELELAFSSGSNTEKRLYLKVSYDYSEILKPIFLTLIVIGLSTFIAFVVIKINNKKAEEKNELNKKISELQLAGLQGQMNPHFIFNALGAIQYFIQTNDVDKADKYLSEFARLMRGILDSSSRKYISLEDELKLLKLYSGLEKLRFENKFDVVFSVDESVDTELLIPPMIIQPYIENAVNHGLHHLINKKGLLEVTFDTIGDSKLQIIIKDNGIGRKASEEVKTNKNHKSKGMGITAERIRTINESSDLKISIEVNDLYDNFSPAGTQVTIIIKD